MKKLVLLSAAAALSLAIACGGSDKANPAAPTANGNTTGASIADGTTLKVTAPAQVSPANGSTLDVGSPTLVINAASAKYVQGEVFAYRFQVLRGSTVIGEHRTSATSWAVDVSPGLDNKTTYGWRARAEQGAYFGPWSDTWTFTTPDQPEGYIRGGELYDPLINGKTVGNIIGNVTFIPGVGAKLNDLSSYIEYRLGSTVVGGEFSIIVTNMIFNTEGDKTKVMAMTEGDSDITTNDRRFTIEKRGNPAGAVAWRVRTSDDQIDTSGAERIVLPFDPSKTYFWKATWGANRFNLLIKDGGPNGNTIYNFGKGYNGVYDPNPHVAYVGGPGGRAGANSGSVPDMIIRQVWLSSRPRPAFANQ